MKKIIEDNYPMKLIVQTYGHETDLTLARDFLNTASQKAIHFLIQKADKQNKLKLIEERDTTPNPLLDGPVRGE